MKYYEGSEIRLGDIVSIPTPGGDVQAQVVMLGDSGEHLVVDKDFVQWVQRDNILSSSSVFLEWVGDNPFAHYDQNLAPVGNFISTVVDEDVRF